jgi:hypothetical protein
VLCGGGGLTESKNHAIYKCNSILYNSLLLTTFFMENEAHHRPQLDIDPIMAQLLETHPGKLRTEKARTTALLLDAARRVHAEEDITANPARAEWAALVSARTGANNNTHFAQAA